MPGDIDLRLVLAITKTKIPVNAISAMITAGSLKPPGECAPYPFDANPLPFALKPSWLLAITKMIAAPTIPPPTWPPMYHGTSELLVLPIAHKPAVTAGLM
jgi:hypothetical protein